MEIFLPCRGRSVPQPGGESTGDRVGDLSCRDVGWLLLKVLDLSGSDLSIVLLNLGKKEIESSTSAMLYSTQIIRARKTIRNC